jgi:hypothetical protein
MLAVLKQGASHPGIAAMPGFAVATYALPSTTEPGPATYPSRRCPGPRMSTPGHGPVFRHHGGEIALRTLTRSLVR